MHLAASVLAVNPSQDFEELFSRCLLCGVCEQVCSRQLPITDIISKARSRFSLFYGEKGVQKAAARTVLDYPLLLKGLVRLGSTIKQLDALPEDSGLRLKLGLLKSAPAEKPANFFESSGTSDVLYFSGCLARYLQPAVARATSSLLDLGNLRMAAPATQRCCGLAAWSSGKREDARVLAKKNIQAFAGSDQPIITSCASCSSQLLRYPELFAAGSRWQKRAEDFAARVQEFTGFFRDVLPPIVGETPEKRLRAFYHDPCHLRYTEQGQKSPRLLLRHAGVEVVEPEDEPACCGQGGLFHIAYPDRSAKIFAKSARGALSQTPDYITTTCSGCLMQFQEGIARSKHRVEVIHLGVLLVRLYP